MRRLVDNIEDVTDNDIKSYSKNIKEIISIIKLKEQPIPIKKNKEKIVETKVIETKEYNNTEKFWLEILDKLGEVNE